MPPAEDLIEAANTDTDIQVLKEYVPSANSSIMQKSHLNHYSKIYKQTKYFVSIYSVSPITSRVTEKVSMEESKPLSA